MRSIAYNITAVTAAAAGFINPLVAAVLMPVDGWFETACLGLAGVQMSFLLVVEPMYQPIQSKGWSKGFSRSYAWQDPDRTVPTAGAMRRAEALRTDLETARGEVLALYRPWWSVIAGGDGHVGTMGLHDVEEDRRRAIQTAVAAEIAKRPAAHPVIVLTSSETGEGIDLLRAEIAALLED